MKKKKITKSKADKDSPKSETGEDDMSIHMVDLTKEESLKKAKTGKKNEKTLRKMRTRFRF